MPVGTHATVEEWERNGKFRASFRNLVMGGRQNKRKGVVGQIIGMANGHG